MLVLRLLGFAHGGLPSDTGVHACIRCLLALDASVRAVMHLAEDAV